MEVQLLDLKRQYQRIKPEIDEAIQRVLTNQHFILGPEVKALEESLGDYIGAKYTLGVSSGSDALLMALMALDVGTGDIVITTSFSFFATAGCVYRLGARPLFAEIEADSYNICPASVRDLLSHLSQEEIKRVKAIIPVHLYGQAANMDELMRIADEYNIAVIEDAAQAIGAKCLVGGQEKSAGSVGKIGCFSFFPTKNLGGYGDGGLITTDDKNLYEKMKILRVHGSSPKYYHKIIGGNFRLDALQAAVLNVKLNYLKEWTDDRISVSKLYRKYLEGVKSIHLPLEVNDKVGCHCHIYHQFVIRAENRDSLRKYLGENGISTQIYYPVPLHLQECFSDLGYRQGDLLVSEKAANEVLALPMYPELQEVEIQYVAKCIKNFYRE